MTVFFLLLGFFLSLIVQPPTNESLVTDKITDFVYYSLQNFEQGDEPIFVSPGNVPPALLRAMEQRLFEAGYRLTKNNEAATILDVQVTPEHSWKQTGRNIAERRLVLHVHLSLVSSGFDVILMTSEVLHYEDELHDAVPELSAGTGYIFEYQKVEMHQNTTVWQRFAEPALLTLSAGITVYLLYNVRSR